MTVDEARAAFCDAVDDWLEARRNKADPSTVYRLWQIARQAHKALPPPVDVDRAGRAYKPKKPLFRRLR